MSDRYFVRITQPTILKLEPKQARDLSSNQVFPGEVGRYEIRAYIDDVVQDHLKFTLKDAVINGRNTWWAYKGHAVLEEEVDRAPEGGKAISFNLKPADRGQKIVLPGTGAIVYTNDRVGKSTYFYWYELTHGGERLPDDRETVGAMIRIAEAADEARSRIGRAFHVTSALRPPAVNRRVGGAKFSRHIIGDALDFYCEGISGREMYRILDPIWESGLGMYKNMPRIVHIDARNHVARWGA